MRITILTVGKIKEPYLREAVQEYSKRLGRYCRLEILETADEKTPDQLETAAAQQVRQREGERLLKRLPADSYVITLEILGRQLSSEKFAQKIDNLAVQGISHIVFVIGGSLGLGRNIREKSDFALSFSEMTYPHQLMRVILLEQIYRSYRIINGEPYHK
ncbi:MAG: 23S rRNA (pseudouridine(1915)-N(3))-methyltransferase RlmH [Lachnospiraceae bacterium]|jgi:23S rRNA (pseudouridine1915-N3)-methyltransferase|nr:23S rRNA (pseudouridine(1915)-N(3))-methyltransferase RlmH [Lachnospiraceae bacterium]MCI9099909.1 23S rRNA (pseudouridine(1915)-N(3))-methyltransferase RlmH [Lachnospiraceae bacterium]MCI9356126.1 23S rRNA (pseudouridine(1915)-N(3))-methyltransferase RlmH [Lachnospiraceae bacterium]